jgi:hypothetical protein
MKNKIILFFQIAALCGVAYADTDLEVGKKLVERVGYGVGEHYFNNLEFTEKKQIKLLTKLQKGKVSYGLTLSPELIFRVTAAPNDQHQIDLKFKIRSAIERYLVDIVFLDKNEILIAVTNPQSGYDFIQFKLVDNNYVPYLYAQALVVPGLEYGSVNKPKEVGFNANGSFFVKFSDDNIDLYTMPSDKSFMLRNNKPYDASQINRYDEGLPDHLKIE